MILVLADDFSGAAEMAGIAHRLGFSSEVQTQFDPNGNSEVVALDTNTRSLPKRSAIAKLKSILNQLENQKPTWIYKKVDSVLRGHVLAETETIMSQVGMELSIIISANPSKQRMVRNGQYWIDQTPLHQTVFANDPTFPAYTSEVLTLLGKPHEHDVYAISCFDTPTSKGVLVPDATEATDVERWAAWLPTACLGVGGVDFFKALLKHRHSNKPRATSPHSVTTPSSRVLACGSLAACQSGRLEYWRHRSMPVFLLPQDWLSSDEQNLPKSWVTPVLESICSGNFCLIGIGETEFEKGLDPSVPAKRLVTAIHALNCAHPIEQLLVEGGETAFLLMQSMEHYRFTVIQSSPEGIPELVPAGSTTPRIVPKPGSYPWPDVFLDAP